MSKQDIESLYLGELAITCPSEIDIDAIAYYKGATVRYRPLTGCEARIIGHGDKAIITVNSDSYFERNRYSVGHELGHWFKHKGSIGNLCQKESIASNRTSFKKMISGKEKVANEYASEFLMPTYLIKQYVGNEDVSFDLILSIKEAFKVSITAAAIRFVNLCEYPVILSCYGSTGRKWFHKSKYVPDNMYPVRHFNRQSPSYQSAISSNNKYTIHEVDADFWIEAKGAENYEVMEAVWKINEHEFMVFNWWKDERHLIDFEDDYEQY